jgi:hypothetical protein
VSKFQLGDRVCSKHTGLPACGVITGIVAPIECCVMQQMNPNGHYWTSLYPDWLTKPVYFVRTDQPQRVVSWHEYTQGALMETDLQKVCAEIGYRINTRVSDMISYPEDDLEIL